MMINKIDILHKIFFITISSIVLLVNMFLSDLITLEIQVYVLFILVSIIGIPHGFFDFTIGKNIFKEYTKYWIFPFSAAYLTVVLIYFLLWINSPVFSLLFFLLISALHFGYEDYNYLINIKKRKIINIDIMVKGIIIVVTPIIFHYGEVANLFFILTSYNFNFIEISFFYKILYVFFLIFYIFLEKNKRFLYKFEELIYLINFIVLPPLISFTIYFCFLHSVRHFFESIFIYKHVPENFTVAGFIITIILISAVFSLLTVFIIVNNYNMNIDETIVRYIFIFLACLTLPHMIFNMKYGEK